MSLNEAKNDGIPILLIVKVVSRHAFILQGSSTTIGQFLMRQHSETNVYYLKKACTDT